MMIVKCRSQLIIMFNWRTSSFNRICISIDWMFSFFFNLIFAAPRTFEYNIIMHMFISFSSKTGWHLNVSQFWITFLSLILLYLSASLHLSLCHSNRNRIATSFWTGFMLIEMRFFFRFNKFKYRIFRMEKYMSGGKNQGVHFHNQFPILSSDIVQGRTDKAKYSYVIVLGNIDWTNLKAIFFISFIIVHNS